MGVYSRNGRRYVRILLLIASLSSVGPSISIPLTLPQSSVANQANQSAEGSQSALTDHAVPQDAKELLLAAAQVNGLDDPGLKPWHILVSFDKYDEDGDNVDSGTYEEFWVGASQYRLTYTSQDFAQTDFATENGLFRTGNEKWPGELQTRVRDEFVRPMFRELNLRFAKPEKKMRDFGKLQLPCVMLRGTGGNMVVSDNGLAAFCFEPNSLMLRYSKGGMAAGTVWDQIVYDRIVRSQGRYVAGDIQVMRGGKPFLKLHLEKLESIPSPNPTDFIPPPTAVAIDNKPIVANSGVLILDYLVHQKLPQYPKSIRPPGGEATVEYRINKEGRVTTVRFVEGNSQMQKGLEEALRKFVYRPFLVRGEPVEVEVKQKFVYEIH
jgi:hypothetical protein